MSSANIKLTASEGELIKRIIERNKFIELGKNDGIKVDGPDYLTRLKLFFDDNQADKQIEIDVEGKTIKSIILEILNNVG